MEFAEVMVALEADGSEKARDIARRHGVRSPVFGVSQKALAGLERQIGIDHELALELWASTNHDARLLAAKVADPSQVTARHADQLARDADNHLLAGAVADLVGRAPVARSRCDVWRDRRGEWVASIGWGLVARTCEEEEMWSIAELRGLLRQIEDEIHDRPNRVRHEMTMALICIALRNAALQKQALSAAKRIGPVEVDHGETQCTTPDATEYIEKTVGYRQRRAVRSG